VVGESDPNLFDNICHVKYRSGHFILQITLALRRPNPQCAEDHPGIVSGAGPRRGGNTPLFLPFRFPVKTNTGGTHEDCTPRIGKPFSAPTVLQRPDAICLPPFSPVLPPGNDFLLDRSRCRQEGCPIGKVADDTPPAPLRTVILERRVWPVESISPFRYQVERLFPWCCREESF
jgi:hypothetical protein